VTGGREPRRKGDGKCTDCMRKGGGKCRDCMRKGAGNVRIV